ncbi:hypothetical protein MBLNU459_g7832t1 [Dothideomycetes sp. NU459]
MLPQLTAPNLRVPAVPLTQQAFSHFGTVIENPERNPASALVNHNVVKANQGSALKYIDISHLTDYYYSAPSRKPAKAVMNMFVCSPRQLEDCPSTGEAARNESGRHGQKAFPVRILERHPFTPQTFIPTGLSPDDTLTAYLVIVAPTLPTSSGVSANRPPPYPQQAPKRRRSITDIFSKARPSPFTNDNDPPRSRASPAQGPPLPKGIGQPDLSQLKAFIANGSQSVTYGPGTWHAPMVVLGEKSIDFVVVQYANGVGLEDCQEIEIKPASGSDNLNVLVGEGLFGPKLESRARL